MTTKFRIALALILAGCIEANAQTPPPGAAPPAVSLQQAPATRQEQEVIDLSRQKWRWMAEKNTEALDKMIDANAAFVHMGATMGKVQELEVIKTGRIEYKQADIEDIGARTIGETVIVLSRIQLFAMVGGNEARNPFMVTEIYVKQSGSWKLAALAFTRRLTPP
jgi:Domain of unknown function (DUF4440)